MWGTFHQRVDQIVSLFLEGKQQFLLGELKQRSTEFKLKP